MFSPSELNANLQAEVSSVLNAVHRAAFDDAEARGDRPDPLLAVPVRLIPLVQTTRSMRRELAAQKARCAQLSAVLDMLTDAIVVIDADRRVLLANAGAHRVASIDESARFRFADPCADKALDAALEAMKAAAIWAPRPQRSAGFRLVKLPGLQAAFLLVLAASGSEPVPPNSRGKPEPAR